MGESWLLDYYRYAIRVLAAFHQLSTHGQKFWPWIFLLAYLIWKFAPIFGQQISILDPPYVGLFGPSCLNFHPMGKFGGGGDLASDIFCHGHKHDYLSRASQRARGATKNSVWNCINMITTLDIGLNHIYNSVLQ